MYYFVETKNTFAKVIVLSIKKEKLFWLFLWKESIIYINNKIFKKYFMKKPIKSLLMKSI